MKINLAKALKIKNRITGELRKQMQVLQRENSQRADKTHQIDPKDILVKITNLSNNLITLKTAINNANSGIVKQLAFMEESKSYISFLEQLRGYIKEEEIDYNGTGSTPARIPYNTAFTNYDIDKMVKEVQQKIGENQDFIDDFNATTFIEISNELIEI